MERKSARGTGFSLKTGFALLLALALSSVVFTASASAQVGGRPIIAGQPVVGQTLTSSSAGLAGQYKWQRCNSVTATCADDPANDPDWVDIPGANAQTYTIPPADLGYMLRVNTRSPVLQPLWTPSAPVGPVTNPPPPPPPEANTGVASGITDTGATLNGTVDPNGVATSYHFEYGTTGAYGSQAPIPDGGAGAGFADQSVSTAISGLSPSTLYHYRLVATSAGGTASGSDATFTTAAPPPPAAEHGISLFAETTAGTVTVKLPGQSEFVPLEGLQVIPIRSLIDARNGRVEITAATGPYANRTLDESMEYYQGMFKILQSPKTNSRAVARLAGPPVCGPFVHRSAEARGASGSGPQAVAARRRGRRLWGSGRGSYATAGRGGTGSVVGTTYLTEEKCKGTYFRVSDEPGAHGISVKVEGQKKPVFLGPGESFLAER